MSSLAARQREARFRAQHPPRPRNECSPRSKVRRPDVDLAAEWRLARRQMSWPVCTWLLRQGVQMSSLLFCPGWRVGVMSIAPDDDGLWAPDDGGRNAIVLPANSFDDGVIDDLVAFLPENPKRFWRRTGRAVVMGLAAHRRAAFARAPLTIYASPLSWLRADRAGVVLLDEAEPLLVHLPGITDFVCDEVEAGHRLQWLLSWRRQVPRVLVPRWTLRGAE